MSRLYGPGGATVARSTPDRKAACSNHVRVIFIFCVSKFQLLRYLSTMETANILIFNSNGSPLYLSNKFD